jgi:hypothetical protein
MCPCSGLIVPADPEDFGCIASVDAVARSGTGVSCEYSEVVASNAQCGTAVISVSISISMVALEAIDGETHG